MDFTLQAILDRVLAGASKDIKTVTYICSQERDVGLDLGKLVGDDRACWAPY